MRLLTALDKMILALTGVDASQRQLDGVRAWHAEVAEAVTLGSRYRTAPGMTITTAPQQRRRRPAETRFIHGDVTHAAWRDLCGAIITALSKQEQHAETLVHRWAAEAASAPTVSIHTRAVRQARLAHAWWDAALAARETGLTLVAVEDAVHVPVGLVIRQVGADDVALDKHYHQRGTKR